MQLQHAEVPVPTPGKEQVLVKVEAAGVNPVDWKFQQGVFRPFGPAKMPCIPGKSWKAVVTSMSLQTINLTWQQFSVLGVVCHMLLIAASSASIQSWCISVRNFEFLNFMTHCLVLLHVCKCVISASKCLFRHWWFIFFSKVIIVHHLIAVLTWSPPCN